MWSSLGSEPLPPHPRWVPEPNGRGTYGILSSCLITLTLCIWSCLHLNVPENRSHLANPRTIRHRVLAKIKWVLLGMVVPEMVAFIAAAQWNDQRQLGSQMRRVLRTELPKEQPSRLVRSMLHFFGIRKAEEEITPPVKRHRLHAWTATHSFLVIMGGFAFDNSHDPSGCAFPQGRHRLTILADGVQALAEMEPDLLPDLSVDAIRDKSKTNGMAKLLACIQALWFCLQMIARMAQHLPLTLLELVTFAHAICALAVYLFWWNKPLDIEEPFLIPVPRDSRCAALCSAMVLGSDIGRRIPCYTPNPTKHERARGDAEAGTKRMVGDVELWPCYQTGMIQVVAMLEYDMTEMGNYVLHRATGPEPTPSDLQAAEEGQENEDAKQDSSNDKGVPAAHEGGTDMSPRDQLETVVLDLGERHTFVSYDFWQMTSPVGFPFIFIARKRDIRVVLDTAFWEPFNYLADLVNHPGELLRQYELLHLLQSDKKHVSICAKYRTSDLPDNMLVLWLIASLLYSGWHLTAWAGPFRTFTTELLWRIASTGPGALMTIILVCSIYDKFYDVDISDFFALYLVVTAFLTVVCRMYLVAESFIGLAYISDAGLQQPYWSPYFPHIA